MNPNVTYCIQVIKRAVYKSEFKNDQMTLKVKVKVVQIHWVLKAMLDAYFVKLVESFMRYCLKIKEIRHNYTKIVKNSAKIHFSK